MKVQHSPFPENAAVYSATTPQTSRFGESMDSRYNGGIRMAEGQHLLPLQGVPPTKKFSESESSTGSEATVATTTDDGGDLLGPTHQKVSNGQHELPLIESIGIGDALLDTVATDQRLHDSGGRLSARLEEQHGHDVYDPFRYMQSTEISADNLDLDQFDAGDMFPDDSDDNGIEESTSSIHHQRMLPLHNVDESDSDILGSSLYETEQDELDYLNGVRTKGVDIHKPKTRNPANGYQQQITPASSTASLASILQTPPNGISMDGSSRPALYSAICSLEKASANSFGKIRFQHEASSSRAFDRDQGVLIPPARTDTVQPVTVVPPKRSVRIAEETSKEKHRHSKQDGSLPMKTNSKRGYRLVDGSCVQKEFADTTHGESLDPAPDVLRCESTAPVELPESIAKETSHGKRTKQRRQLKKVTIKEAPKPMEIFRPSSDAYTPRVAKKNFKFKPAEMRTTVLKSDQNMGTLSRPNFRDALKRVAMIVKQHIVKIEQRFDGSRAASDGLFRASMLEAFAEDKFATPTYRCTMVRLPMACPGMLYGLRTVKTTYGIPTEEEIYEFGHQLFKSVQLSSECSIVCLIYMERLMEVAKVPLVSRTWRTIFMCGLLLASKVWQDLSSWNIEFASVYPQFSLEAINRLEVQFLKMIKWDLYISSSLYAKYYFALRSILEKQDFRMRYNRMVGGVGNVDATEALKIQLRSELVKEEALLQISRSM